MRNRTILLLLLVLAGCSSDDNSSAPDAKREHVWQEQTDMIERAKGVEELLGDANLQHRQQLDAQTQ